MAAALGKSESSHGSLSDVAAHFENQRTASIVAAFEGALQKAIALSSQRYSLGLMGSHIQGFLHPELLANDPLILEKIVRTLLGTRCTTNSVFSVLADIQENDAFKDADRFSMENNRRPMVQKLDLGRLREAGLLVNREENPPDLIGAGWRAGRLEVTGDVGRSAGQHMQGGELLIKGKAGPFLGEQMHGGTIRAFEAQSGVGRGMNGGEITVMRLDSAFNPSIGEEMCDGSISIHSASGTMKCGEGMRGGTIRIANAGTVTIGAHFYAGEIILIDCAKPLGTHHKAGGEIRVVSTKKQQGFLRTLLQETGK